MRLAKKLFLIGIIPIIIFTITYPIIFTVIIENQLFESSKLKAQSLIQFIAVDVTNFIYFNDIDAIEEKIKSLKMMYPLGNFYVMRSDGRIITDGTSNNEFFDKVPGEFLIQKSIGSNDMLIQNLGDRIHISHPIIMSEKIGIIFFEYLIPESESIVFASQISLIIIMVISIIIALIITLLVVKSIKNPILKLRNATSEIAYGKLKTPIEVSEPEEIKQLADDIKLMAVKLEKSKEAIIRSEHLSAIGELSSRISHDLRNPLSVLKNAVFVIESKNIQDLSPSTKKNLQIIKNAVDEMNHIIKNVLDFVRIQDIKRESIKLLKLLDETLIELSIPNNINVVFPKKDIILFCDKNLFKVVLQNLIKNAIDAIGSNKGEIIILSSDLNDETIIEVSDTGPGIPEKSLSKIFDPLYTTKDHGTGLGLVSCKSIVEQHGGEISAFNSMNGGATFRIKLPKSTMD